MLIIGQLIQDEDKDNNLNRLYINDESLFLILNVDQQPDNYYIENTEIFNTSDITDIYLHHTSYPSLNKSINLYSLKIYISE